VPVVIVTGDKDKVVSPKDNAYRLKNTLASADLIEVKDAGHEIPQTHPEIIYAAIKKVSESQVVNRQ
jgi:pimeloyl-ACP methyl ester carboxylesterase